MGTIGSIVNILTPAVSTDLTTVEVVKQELGITDTSADNKLLNYIRQASDLIARYCNRSFGLQTVEEVFLDVCFRGPIALRHRPVVSIISLVESTSVIDPADYELDKERGMLHRATFGGLGWHWAGDIVVEYQAGYDLLNDYPYDIERACVLLVKQSYFASTRDPTIRSEDIPGVASYSYGFGTARAAAITEIPPEVTLLLDSHRELTLA